MSLPKPRRVLRSSEFRKIYETGVRISNRFFVAFCLRADGPAMPARFGFTVPRSLGKAVERNRLKRRMREAVRTQLGIIPPNWAIVFNPRRSASEASFEDLCHEVGRIFLRCRDL